MENRKILSANWLTRKPLNDGLLVTLFCTLVLLLSSYIYIFDIFDAHSLWAGEKISLFEKHQYWRAWTALFAHADLVHIGSNLVLFFPFCYYLASYYGLLFFPFFGFFMGGIANFFVLALMPSGVSLVGVSGVVHWMGGAWMALLFLIDKRDVGMRRLIKVLGVSIMLFIPDTYNPTVSYKSHGIGFALGVFSGVLYYYINEIRIRKADVFITRNDDVPEWYLQMEEERLPPTDS